MYKESTSTSVYRQWEKTIQPFFSFFLNYSLATKFMKTLRFTCYTCVLLHHLLIKQRAGVAVMSKIYPSNPEFRICPVWGKQVTRGHNIVAHRWEGASNPNPYPPQPHAHLHTQTIIAAASRCIPLQPVVAMWVYVDVRWLERQQPQRGRWLILGNLLILGSQSWNLGLKAGILASRLGFWPQGWDFGLTAGFLASRLGFGPQ